MGFRLPSNGLRLRQRAAILLGVIVFLYVWFETSRFVNEKQKDIVQVRDLSKTVTTEMDWESYPQQHPLDSVLLLPQEKPAEIPRIQHKFGREDPEAQSVRLERLKHVKEEFLHAWNGYKTYTMMHDEIKPLSDGFDDPFGGWGATLVDTLG